MNMRYSAVGKFHIRLGNEGLETEDLKRPSHFDEGEVYFAAEGSISLSFYFSSNPFLIFATYDF
jgi:hypothetical protein